MSYRLALRPPVNLGPSKRPADSEPGWMLAMPDFSA
jgi:hypothetical protein